MCESVHRGFLPRSARTAFPGGRLVIARHAIHTYDIASQASLLVWWGPELTRIFAVVAIVAEYKVLPA